MREHGVSIRMACLAFGVSQTCYRYVAKTDAESEEIANWLLRLTDNHRNWGFGLCFLYLRNVCDFGWNHYRIYRELELNLRIKPRKRLVRQVDHFNREALGIEIDFSVPSERVIRTLKQIIGWRGPPAIRCDNGPAYLSAAIVGWRNCSPTFFCFREVQFRLHFHAN